MSCPRSIASHIFWWLRDGLNFKPPAVTWLKSRFNFKNSTQKIGAFTATNFNHLYVFIVNFERFQGFSYGSLIYYVHKIFRKSNIFYLLIRTRACACQGARNVRFLEDFANAINEWSLRTLSNTHNGVNFAKIVKQGICWDLGKEVCN